MTTALAIFVKTAGLSPLKTRLAQDIGRADAEQFHELSAAAVGAVARAVIPAITPFWAVAEAVALTADCWQDFECIHQGSGSLGDRLDHICRVLLTRHDRVLMIGADTPQITPHLLHRAAAHLACPDTPFVLGPAADGGFWLFGTRQPVSTDTWTMPRYSSPHAATDLRIALADQGRIAPLPVGVDGDRGADLPHITAALDAIDRPLPEQVRLKQWLKNRLTTHNDRQLEEISP